MMGELARADDADLVLMEVKLQTQHLSALCLSASTLNSLTACRGRRWPEDTPDILEELLREDRHPHLGCGRHGQGAPG